MRRILQLGGAACVLAGLLIVYFVFAARQEEGDEQQPVSQQIQLIASSVESISRVLIETDAGQIALSFDDGHITRSDAEQYVLDQWMLAEMTRGAWSLWAFGVAFEDVEPPPLADIGLDPPQILVNAAYVDGTIHRLQLGYHTSDMSRMFAMIDDDPTVYLIAARVGEQFLTDVPDLLDVALPRIAIDNLMYMYLNERGRLPIEIDMDVDAAFVPEGAMFMPPGGANLFMAQPFFGIPLAHWSLDENVLAPFARFQIERLHEFSPPSLAPFGLDNPSLIAHFRTTTDDLALHFGDRFFEYGMEFVYVAFAGRPHVFVAPFWGAASLFDLHPMRIVERFITLISIADVDYIRINSPQGLLDMAINHVDPALVEAGERRQNEIDPTVNGIDVEAAWFRTGYMLIVGLSAETGVEEHMPAGEPEITITYHMTDGNLREIRLFRHSDNFFAISLDGEPAWQLVGARAVSALLDYFGVFVR